MINSDKRDQIIKQIGPHHVIPSDISPNVYWDDYFLNYYEPVKVFEDGKSFFTYKDTEKFTWIQDFVVGDLKSAYRLLEKMDDMAKKKPIKMQTAITNVKVINILLERNLKIQEISGYNYIIGKG